MMQNQGSSDKFWKDEENSTGEGSGNVEPNSGSLKWNARNIFTKYLDRCSATGVSFIRGSENKYVRTAWSLLLFLAIFGMAIHLSLLIASFFEYSTYSKVDYTYNRLKFPAVTICNANPIGLSKVSLGSEPLKYVLEILRPKFLEDAEILPLTEIDNPHYSYYYYMYEDNGAMNGLFLHAFEKLENMTGNRYPQFNGSKPVDAEQVALMQTLLDTFKNFFGEINEETRKKMGHQLDDMILMCYFNGKICDRRHFRVTSNLVYGNCYTFQHDELISSKSGMSKGLTIVFRLEMDEYIHTVSEGYGAQVVVHERNTMAFPDEDGIALTAGSSTMIGIRQVEISRLSKPYGKCSSVEYFRKKYKVKPTRNLCYKLCEQTRIVDKCNCYEVTRQGINKILNITGNVDPCESYEELQCIDKEEEYLSYNFANCDCDSPCKEVKFEKTISVRQWPTKAFMDLLVQSVCLHSPDECSKLTNKDKSELQNEFLMVKIYFEDLNYEVYQQTEDYEMTEFFSDIGGTIGLWIGLSLLGLCEVLHLVIELLLYLCRRV